MKNTCSRVFLFALAAALVAAAASRPVVAAAARAAGQTAQQAIPAPPDVAAPPADAPKTASGLASKVLKAGKGTVHPGPTSRVTVHYSGWTTDGKMFDSSVVRKEPATFPLNRVIPGWTEGVQLMVEGETRRFWIPVELAYNNREGRPKGMLVFDVELIRIEPAVSPNPVLDGLKTDYVAVRRYITRAAEQVPESLYGFKPTPEVRSFGQLFAHIADGNYEFCGPVAGEKPSVQDIEKTKTTKADIVAALGASFAYCDTVLGAMTDADGAKMADFFGQPLARLSIFAANTSHDNEHYGNIVTYMRLNKMVPPSSQR